MAAVELVQDKETREPFAAEQGVPRKVFDEALANGLLSRVLGNQGLALSPRW